MVSSDIPERFLTFPAAVPIPRSAWSRVSQALNRSFSKPPSLSPCGQEPQSGHTLNASSSLRERLMPHTDVGRSEGLLTELAAWVALETPTTDAGSVNRLMDVAEAELTQAGARLTRIPGRDGYGDNLIARTPGEGKPVVVAGHLDTVWSLGTLDTMPYQVNGEKAHGPGIYDMKAGSFLAFHAVRSILRQRVKTRRPIVLLLTPDEEVGSPTSREWIEREASDAACVLIPEPAGQGGACVTARKGVGRFMMRVEGRGAHSGGNFQDGASAVVELARQIVRLHGLVDLDRGITLNAAPIWGGSRPNVISPDAGCEIDLRVNSVADGETMEQVLLETTALTPGCRVVVEGGMNRPPFAENPGIISLYDKARGVAETVGIALPRQHRGGGSDGNFTAAMGVPTLDGLGCPGAGAHASHEHILWQQLAPRAALMAGLLEVLE
jgi:glutamate carboxypeptidase